MEIQAFFQGKPNCVTCWEALDARLRERYPTLARRIQKTQISYDDPKLFCCVSMPRWKVDRPSIVVTFAIDAPIADVRIFQAVQVTPNRWTHHVQISDMQEVDEQLMVWIDASHQLKCGGKR